jgi:UDP-2,3-diacylglucosamine hydrolase
MSIFFIADLHLSPETPKLNLEFRRFCSSLEYQDSLYIIGDLFGYFIGIDPSNDAQLAVKETIIDLHKKNVNVFFIHGNRDFLLSKKDAEYFGFKLLPDVSTINLINTKIIILHGDELCKGNIAYFTYRYISRLKFLQFLFKALTHKEKRVSIAEKMRKQSHIHFLKNNCCKEKILVEKAIHMCSKKHASILIHGHTHNAEHTNINSYQIYDIGDWNNNQYTYIKISKNNEISLIKKNFNNE